MLLKIDGIAKRVIGAACACALAATMLLLAGCSQPTSLENAAKKEPTPSGYMTSVNAASSELRGTFEEFAEAVIAGDVFTMQAKADAAYATLNKIADIEAPSELSDVKAKYGDAVNSLKGALDEYVALFEELQDAQAGVSFDYGTYADRIEEIQKKYDDGLNALEEADSAASEK